MLWLINLFFIIITAFFISGCENLSEEEKICRANPSLCEDLHYDSFCPDARLNVILARENSRKAVPTRSRALYHELIESEKYRECIGLKSQIRHVQHKSREGNRTEAYLAILEKIKIIEQETKKDKDPYLSYYHWSRHQDRSALQRFLNAEKKDQIDSPELMVYLSNYYKIKDPEKSLTLLKAAINKTPFDDVNIDWLTNVALLSEKVGDIDAYIVHYLVVIQLSEQSIDEKMLFSGIKNDPKKIKILRKSSEKLLELLREQSYKKSKYYRINKSSPAKK